MAGAPIETLIETAKNTVRKKVVRAQKNRSPEVLKVLQAIAEGLFKPTFNVDQMTRAGIVDWRIRKQFRAELGLGIKAYLQELRKTVATWLLVKTDLPIKEIAVGLGHARECAYNFSRDFKRWTGETPEHYRSTRRGKLKTDDGWLERVVNEALRAEPREVVLPPGLFVYLGGDDDAEMAEAVWAMLREETPLMRFPGAIRSQPENRPAPEQSQAPGRPLHRADLWPGTRARHQRPASYTRYPAPGIIALPGNQKRTLQTSLRG